MGFFHSMWLFSRARPLCRTFVRRRKGDRDFCIKVRQPPASICAFFEHEEIEGETVELNIPRFTSQEVNRNNECVGAHEFGHVLGLYDVDKLCGSSEEVDHHGGILMGYGNVFDQMAQNPTYKDIAGVSITRGFHTDDNHRWMIRTRDDGSTYLICSLCNGIRTEFTLTNGIYEGQTPVVYGSCNDNHSLTGGNMLLVATDGIRDFYKCMKCR